MLSKTLHHSLVFCYCFLLITMIVFIPHGTVARKLAADHQKNANGGDNGQSKSGVSGSHSPSGPSATTQLSPPTLTTHRAVENCGRSKVNRNCLPSSNPGSAYNRSSRSP
ncbi:hypothetical protein OWV82_016775 [Melia azedarach]|uniref:Uncharacterized protein n=1 Tax=Melia azedarach TaxID=155640 RepID=A0ACC1XHK4_MELAZ|nr:hypothetical protein OWV82_016775 [Melia azedarach]